MSIFHAQRAAIKVFVPGKHDIRHLPRSESSNAISAENSVALQCFAACPNSNGSTLFDRGWQQPLNCHKAPPVYRVKDAEGTAQPLVLDSVRWWCYFVAHQYISRVEP